MANSCAFDGCFNPIRRDGLCQSHVLQLDAGKELAPLRAYVSALPPKVECAVGVCDRTSYGRGVLCRGHAAIARSYSLSQVDYAAMYALGCSVCERRDVTLSVDHDHGCCPKSKKSCGKCVRGLACADCNFLLGWIDKIQLPKARVLSNLQWYFEEYEMLAPKKVG